MGQERHEGFMRDLATWELVVAVFGVVVAIYFGAKSVSAKKSRANNQRQTSSRNSTSIQSGRDTKIK